MRYVLALLVLISNPAYACDPAKTVISALLGNEFQIVATFELDKKPAAMFINPYGDWIVFTREGEMLCHVASGQAFDFIPERYL